MGQLYAMECDVCGKRQVEKDPAAIKGHTYTENSQQKFACASCRDLMKAAFEIKRRGLRQPLTKVAGLIRQRDEARREAEELRATLGGTNPFAGRLGETVPPLEGKTERPALPEPKKRRKKELPHGGS